jgi:signal transduction histidine kinase/DNA-binding response OmpR family regulator
VILDGSFIIQSWSGDHHYYGFDCLATGNDCRDCMLFLIGLNNQDSIHLRYIDTPNARSAHVQIFCGINEITLVLLDATEQRINHSVVQQKGNELALMHIEQNRLIDNLKRLEKEIEAKRRQAEQANQLKSQFIATMSHEFRTPLTSIIGYTSRLKQTTSLDPASSIYLSSVEGSAQHLLSLVENLLDHSQIEIGSLSIKRISTNVRVVLDKIKSIFEPLAEDKQLDFNIDIDRGIPEYLCLDEMRFRQILVNLMSNAIKFTKQGFIGIKASWIDDQLTVSVEDTGSGIAKADQQRIFSAFECLDNHLGTGLGLSIVKHLVAAMDGQLVLASVVNQGSRFEVSIPAPQLAGSNDRCSPILDHRLHKRKKHLETVLLVEDDRVIMQLLQSIFDEADCYILVASTGDDAINQALSEWPDLILLDLNLPDITGFEVIKTLRNNSFHNPVFIQSAWVSTEYKARAIAAGCNEYLLKPLDIPHLMMLVSQYFIKRSDFGMPTERYQQLHQRFVDSLPEKRKTLQQLEVSSQHNWTSTEQQQVHSYVHRLAGSAALYGMHTISRISKQLDQLLLDYEQQGSHHADAQLRKKILNTLALLGRQLDQAIISNKPNVL